MNDLRSMGILIAMKEELYGLLRHFPLEHTGPGDFYTGRIGNMRAQVALSGAGLERSLETANRLARMGEPQLLLSVGLSAGLRSDLKVGDLLLASQAQTPEGPVALADSELLERARQKTNIRVGGYVSSTVVISTSEDKAALAAACPAASALDMESYALAEAAASHGLPWLGLRSISDSIYDSLPLDFNDSMNPQGQVSRLRVAQQIARRPQSLSRLLRFAGQVQKAQTSLWRGLDQLLGSLTW